MVLLILLFLKVYLGKSLLNLVKGEHLIDQEENLVKNLIYIVVY